MARSYPDECPGCGNEQIVSVREARAVYRVKKWGGQTTMLDYSELVCPTCKAVRINGDWTRMQSVRERAYELSQASSSKSKSDYREILTAGSGNL
jgi:hypothetical protein